MTFLFCACLWLPILAHTFLTTDIDPRRWIMAAPLAAFVLFTLLPLQVYAEELIFRGYLQRWLETRLNGSLRAAFLQSALFALLHPGLLVPAFLLGFAATELTRQTRSLGAATALHLANNLAIYLIAFNPATDGKLLDGHVAVSPLPFGFMPGVAIVIACLLVLPYILVRLTGKAEREVGLSASGS